MKNFATYGGENLEGKSEKYGENGQKKWFRTHKNLKELGAKNKGNQMDYLNNINTHVS